MIFKCSICGKEFKEVSAVIKSDGYVRNFKVYASSSLLEEKSRKYFNEVVESIIYKCDCGEKEILANSSNGIDLDDFYRNNSIIPLTKKSYGDLIVIY